MAMNGSFWLQEQLGIFEDAGRLPYYQLPEWSKDLLVYEAPLARDINKAVSGAVLGAGIAKATKFLKPLLTKVDDAAQGGKTVLGSYPDYLNLADDLGAKRFSIPQEIWDKMSGIERWAANQKFLDRTIARGDEIILSNNGYFAREGSSFYKEIQYLLDKGFRLSQDGLSMLPPGQ